VRLVERIERLPVEDWAAAVGRGVRRIRRRAARRRALILGVAGGGVLVAAVAGNALFGQTAPHPAPLWGAAEREMAVAAHGGAAEVVEAVEPTPLVAKIQEELGQQGFFAGDPTGILDEATRSAIRTFERTQGLPETGEPSVALLAAVGAGVKPVPRPEPLPRLSVSDMQRILNEKGFGPLEVDGLMGPRTRAALERFAAERGISAADLRAPAMMRALAEGGA